MEIRCRARLSSACQHGQPEQPTYEESQREDGTYDIGSNSVVCTPCYLAIGMPLLHEIPAAIATARQILAEQGAERSNE